MLRMQDIPRIAERQLVNEMFVAMEELCKAAGTYVERPREWQIIKIVWRNNLHDAHTSVCEVARVTGLPRTTSRRYLNMLVAKGKLDKEPEGYCVVPELLHSAALRELADGRTLLDQHIDLIIEIGKALERMRMTKVDTGHNGHRPQWTRMRPLRIRKSPDIHVRG